MRNVHIYPSNFSHESRILKEATTLAASLDFQQVDLVGVKDVNLPATQVISDRVIIHRLGPTKGRGMMKAVRHLLWCLNVTWFCLTRGYGVVNCHSLPVLPIGAFVRLITPAKLVYDTHELETETAGSSPRRRRIGRLVERICIRFVSLIIVVSPGIEKWYRQQYGVERIITVLNAPRYRNAISTTRTLLGDPSAKVVLYQGVLAKGRGIEHLVEASELIKDAGYSLVFLGYGAMEQDLRDLARTRPFHVLPAVPPEDLWEYTAAAHIGVCLIEDICLSYHLSLPNKLFEYGMARIPVVASDMPEIRYLVEKWQIGACIAAWDAASILRAIQQAEAIRDGAFVERAESLAQTVSWERQEEVLCNGYRSFVLT